MQGIVSHIEHEEVHTQQQWQSVSREIAYLGSQRLDQKYSSLLCGHWVYHFSRSSDRSQSS